MRRSTLRVRAMPALGALALTFPLAAFAAGSDTSNPISIRVKDAHVTFGQPIVVTGHAPRGPVQLQFRPQGGTWRTLRAAQAGRDGRFRFRAAAPAVGIVRVLAAGTGATAATTPASSAAKAISVTADVDTSRKRLRVAPRRRAVVRGVVRPAVAGQAVAVQVRGSRGWRTVARDRASQRGGFRVAFEARRSGLVRVHTANAGVRGAREVIGRLGAFRPAMASWYGPGLYGNSLACGGTLTPGTLGVANKSLPCGTKVTLRYHGNTVTVPVVDRGPYVAGREFDLTAATKNRLGFGSTGIVQVSY